MIRLSKMADYAVVLLTYLAASKGKKAATAKQLAEVSMLPLPTVSKILKACARSGILKAQRGYQGGYQLVRHERDVSVADIVTAVDGPIAMTDCSDHSSKLCDIEASCPVRANLGTVTNVVYNALGQLTLADLAQPHLAPKANAGQHPALPVLGN